MTVAEYKMAADFHGPLSLDPLKAEPRRHRCFKLIASRFVLAHPSAHLCGSRGASGVVSGSEDLGP